MKIYVLGDSRSIGCGSFLSAYLQGIIEYSRKEGEEEALLNLDKPQGANGGASGMVLSFLKSKGEASRFHCRLAYGIHKKNSVLKEGKE